MQFCLDSIGVVLKTQEDQWMLSPPRRRFIAAVDKLLSNEYVIKDLCPAVSLPALSSLKRSLDQSDAVVIRDPKKARTYQLQSTSSQLAIEY